MSLSQLRVWPILQIGHGKDQGSDSPAGGGVVLGCLGAPRGSLEMCPEAGRAEGNLSHCDDPMRLGRRVLGSGYLKPLPTRPQHSSTLQEQGSKSNYFLIKKKSLN